MKDKSLKLVNKKQLVDLLSNLYKDAEMGLTGHWIPEVENDDGWQAQQILIDEFCKSNKLRIRRKI